MNRVILAVALLISVVAAFYSVTGLAAIFTGATIAVIIMGAVLEAGKVAAAAWLHKYWHLANKALKVYLCTAVVLLMAITSMGTFGFLSKAHLQNTSGTTVAIQQVKQYDETIKRIESELSRLDAQTTSLDVLVTGADPERASAVRNRQRNERAQISERRAGLYSERDTAAAARDKLRTNVAGAEAEIGPIKYVAELIYGTQADAASYDKAVRWMIILLVVVFDPLAISLLIAAQSGFEIERKRPAKLAPLPDIQPIIPEPILEENIAEEVADVPEEVIPEETEAQWLSNVRAIRKAQPDANNVSLIELASTSDE